MDTIHQAAATSAIRGPLLQPSESAEQNRQGNATSKQGFSDMSQATFKHAGLKAIQEKRKALIVECQALETDQEIDRVAGEISEHEERIVEFVAEGPEDLQIKLSVLWEYLCPTPETEGDLRNRLVRSIMADVERMAEQQSNS